jgi:cyclase
MTIRIIPRIDIKGINVIKGIQMDGLRIIGNPSHLASSYYYDGADEIAFFDVVASLYGRNNLTQLVSEVARASFIPLTVTGGIRSIEDARRTMGFGADKVGMNTAAINNPRIISDVARVFGNQAAVVSVEARRKSVNDWEAFTESGREPSGKSVLDWARQAEALGAGEISVTSVDRDGTLKGPDLDLINELRSITTIPLVVGGGLSNLEHVGNCAELGVDGLMIGLALHKKLLSINECKEHLNKLGFGTRQLAK